MSIVPSMKFAGSAPSRSTRIGDTVASTTVGEAPVAAPAVDDERHVGRVECAGRPRPAR